MEQAKSHKEKFEQYLPVFEDCYREFFDYIRTSPTPAYEPERAVELSHDSAIKFLTQTGLTAEEWSIICLNTVCNHKDLAHERL